MSSDNKLTSLVQQAASSIMMADASDLSEIENLSALLEDISECVQQFSQLPDDLKARAGSAATSAGELMTKIFSKETEDAESSLKNVSETITALQDMVEQIDIETDPANIKVKFPSPDNQAKPEAEQPKEVQPEVESSDLQKQAQKSKVEPTIIDEDDVELVSDFINESGEHIESAEAGLLEVENNPEDSDAINMVFRGFHTIKGMAGFLNLTEIGSLAHAAENLLDLSRKGQLSLVGPNMDVVFESVDMLKTMITSLQEAVDGDKVVPSVPSLPQILGRLKACLQGNPQDAPPAAPPAETPAAVESAEKAPTEYPAVAPETPKLQQDVQEAAKAKPAVTADEKIKVSTSRLDNLVNMVGELVIAQSMVTQAAEASLAPEHQLCQNVVQQGKMVRELQELSMMMRMVPMQGVFQKMARLVRYLCQKSGKRVDFITEGEETELDRIVVDQIADPLVHMIRNSIDHGIESAEDRAAAGKDEKGRVKLRAHHQGGNIVIAIVSGRRIVNTVPLPSKESISIFPRRDSMFFLTTSIPTPLPETSVTFAAVERPA